MATQLKKKKEYSFMWEGVDKKGRHQEGEVMASEENVARSILRTRGLKVNKIKRNRRPPKTITPQDITMFVRQLATMMKAGVPMLQSFEIVGNGHSNPSVGKLLYQIRQDIETGLSLSQAIAKHPKYFDPLFCNLVQAGEQAGILDSILDRIASYKEKMLALKRKIKSALIYPISVISVAVIVVTVIMIFVIPSFKSVFASFGAELPGPTLVVIAISDFMVAYWYIMAGIIGIASWSFSNALKKSKKLRDKADAFYLKLPVFGNLLKQAAIARWARTLSTMFAAGVPLVEALDSVAGASGNAIFYNATKKIQNDITTGTGMAVAMQATKVFPNMVIQMTQIGEESGALDGMLDKIAEFYEAEVDATVENLSTLMEPIILLFLGVVIGGLVVALYLPIFKMGSVV